MNVNMKWRSIVQACALALVNNIALASDPEVQFWNTDLAINGQDMSSSSPAEIAFESKKAEDLSAIEGLKIVYYGTIEFKNKMGSLSVVRKSADLNEHDSNQIVIVESANKDQELFKRLLARGNYIISVGGASIDSARDALDSLFNLDAGLSEAKDDLVVPKNRFRASEGRKNFVFGKVAAYRFSPSGSETFETAEQNEALAVAETIAWVTNLKIEEKSLRTTNVAKADPSPSYTRQNTKNCEGNVINLRSQYIKQSDTNSKYDYWVVKQTVQTVPAANWKTSLIFTFVDTNYRAWTLLDYDPTSTVGTSTASVSVTLAASGPSVAITPWSYTIPDVTIQDGSRFDLNTMLHTHFINANSIAATETYKISPGAQVRTGPSAQSPWNRIGEEASATFKRSGQTSQVCTIDLAGP